MSVNIKLGEKTISGVDSIRVEDADTEGQYDVFDLRGSSDVLFYDYDGTVLYSYSKEQFLTLTEMPANPTREGLTAQGWNWTLSDSKTYLNNHNLLDIGQMYDTVDGGIRIIIQLNEVTGKTFNLRWYQSTANGVNIDWGDSSVVETVGTKGNVSLTHTYNDFGVYHINLNRINNSIIFGNQTYQTLCGDSLSRLAVIELNYGANINNSSYYARCDELVNLQKLTLAKISSGVTVFSGGYSCVSLKHFTYPTHLTRCSTFRGCVSLGSVCLSNSLTTGTGEYLFSETKIKRLSIPNSLSSTGSYWFYNCSYLNDFIWPSTVNEIKPYTFNYCNYFQKIVIPANVTTIGNQCFYTNCSSLKELHFLGTTPPVLSSSAVFPNSTIHFIIYVPKEAVEVYKAATNWSAVAAYIVGV